MIGPEVVAPDAGDDMNGSTVAAPAADEAPPSPPRGSPRLLFAASALVAVIALVAAASILTSGGGGGDGRTAAWAWSPAPKPSDWRYYGWGNPALELALPADWTGSEMPVMSIDPSAPADSKAAQEQANAWLRAGAWRASIGSSMGSGDPAAYDWVGEIVESGDASLAAHADRLIAMSPRGPTGRADVRLPAGQAVAITFTSAGGEGSYVEVDYLLQLPDRRSLTILISRWSGQGPAPDRAAVETLARQIAETLRVTP